MKIPNSPDLQYIHFDEVNQDNKEKLLELEKRIEKIEENQKKLVLLLGPPEPEHNYMSIEDVIKMVLPKKIPEGYKFPGAHYTWNLHIETGEHIHLTELHCIHTNIKLHTDKHICFYSRAPDCQPKKKTTRDYFIIHNEELIDITSDEDYNVYANLIDPHGIKEIKRWKIINENKTLPGFATLWEYRSYRPFVVDCTIHGFKFLSSCNTYYLTYKEVILGEEKMIKKLHITRNYCEATTFYILLDFAKFC